MNVCHRDFVVIKKVSLLGANYYKAPVSPHSHFWSYLITSIVGIVYWSGGDDTGILCITSIFVWNISFLSISDCGKDISKALFLYFHDESFCRRTVWVTSYKIFREAVVDHSCEFAGRPQKIWASDETTDRNPGTKVFLPLSTQVACQKCSCPVWGGGDTDSIFYMYTSHLWFSIFFFS